MSFGRPPSFTTFSSNPPDRGSFPLDHDGECSAFMKEYLICLKENQNNNGKCRHLSKEYLNCRMQKGLMGNDSFKNLGFHDEDQDQGTPSTQTATEGSSTSPPSSTATNDANDLRPAQSPTPSTTSTASSTTGSHA
ncbi:Cytochrome c oxidase assembly protein cox19 [Mortierella polycephala]|uniref:Cytochrome c oxidase assembly protein cox19 n=1 Tax=Mortierella polycephala TaxID=41804 RepID=A0A9P6Q0H0_9FUNG|nr:Cytochrome c oxidase assembly protein cox19 [Mortierella polycephala]